MRHVGFYLIAIVLIFVSANLPPAGLLSAGSPGDVFGVWRSWLAHLVWDQRVAGSSPVTPTDDKESG